MQLNESYYTIPKARYVKDKRKENKPNYKTRSTLPKSYMKETALKKQKKKKETPQIEESINKSTKI